MHRAIIFVSLAFAASFSNANANAEVGPIPLSIQSGIYGNVTESKETGDRGGIELRLYSGVKYEYVEAVVCESECNGEGRYPIRYVPNGFIFSWKSSRYPDDHVIDFKVTKEKNGIWIEGLNGTWMRSKLKRRKKPLGMTGVYEWAKP